MPATDRTQRPRILFVGGSGHHYLRAAVADPADALFVSDPAAPGAAEAMAARGGFAVHDGDLAAAAAAFGPDLVSVGSVYGHAGDHAAEARRLGLPVVTDKPAAATWAQLEALSAGGPPVVTEFDWRTRPALRAARALVAGGTLGPVVLAVAQKTYPLGDRPTFYRDRATYGGTMLWVASHAIDALRFVCGELRAVSARHGNVAAPGIATAEDHAVATLAVETGGGTAVAHADLARPTGHGTHGDDRLVVRCAGGEIEVRGDACTLTTDDGPRAVDLPRTPPPERMLLAAALEEAHPDSFGTAQTLSTARLLLEARDLADAAGA